MSDELRHLATAIRSLAESNQGIGGVLREEVASRLETNRILAKIHDQNAEILTVMERWATEKRESERELRVVKFAVRKHDERIEALEGLAGISTPKLSG